ncbi:MAG: tetratricopeptide repeat protein [Actinobacteria bacterium]|nr:tetratricopeptide repeat protein [Actinomycetota bacterium]
MAGLPTGTVTFLFTDIEGSTHLLQRLGDRYAEVLDTHFGLLTDAFAAHHGHIVNFQGDAVFVAFETAGDAVAAAYAAQEALDAYPWSAGEDVRVRVGVHTGPALQTGDNYVGLAVHEASRICSAAHGGQVVLSDVTRDGVTRWPPGVSTRDLGLHRLKDLPEPRRLYQLNYAGLAVFPRLRSDAAPGNLPKQSTSFVGRRTELADACRQLAGGVSVLTLTGPGGCGKTRLALEVAAEVVDDYPGGAWQVELATVSDPSLVPQAVAKTLDVREEAGIDTLQSLTTALSDTRVLLVLDNCEHLVDACAQVADTLVRACPDVHVLATSQEALGVAGESVLRVSSMPPPDGVQLFVDRARAKRPDFTMTAEATAAIESICRRLDGIPLAIELAAARVNVLSPAQIAERLDDQFRLLTGGSRTALPRQQTLRAAVDWSHELLGDEEQVLLRRLSVFSGGCTLEAAEAVGAEKGDTGWVLDSLDRLVARSLVVAEEQDGVARYRLLETIRQYAREKLAAADEVADRRARHLDWFHELALEAEPQLTGPDQAAWLRSLASEYDNLRAAMEWAAEGERAETVLEMATALWRFWLVRGHWAEGRSWLARGLSATAGELSRSALWARALAAAGDLATEQADYDVAGPLLDASLDLWRDLGEPEGMAKALNHLGNLARSRFEYDTARAQLQEALEIRRAIGNERGIAVSLRNLGLLAAMQRDYETARARYEEALPLARRLGEKRVIATITHALATVLFADGDREGAAVLAEEGLGLARELGDRQGIAEHLTVLAGVRGADGSVGATEATAEATGASSPEATESMVAEALAIWKSLGSRDAIAWAYTTLGEMALNTGDLVGARARLDMGLAAWRKVGDEAAVARLCNLCGWAAMLVGDLDAAHALLVEAVELATAVGDDGQLASTLHSLGEVQRQQGDLVEARRTFEHSLEVAQRTGWKRLLWWPEHGLGAVDRAEGRLADAREQLARAVGVQPRFGRRPALADCLEELAAVELAEAQPGRAARWLGAAARFREQMGAPVPPVRRAWHDELVAAVAGHDDAWNAGAALPVEQVVAEVTDRP